MVRLEYAAAARPFAAGAKAKDFSECYQCLRGRRCAPLSPSTPAQSARPDGKVAFFTGLVVLLSLAPSTDSFQLQGALGSFGPARVCTREFCAQAAPSWLSHGALLRAGAERRGNRAVLALGAGAADFILDSFDPEEEEDELSNENLLKIVYSDTTDQHVNDLVWAALGEEETPGESLRDDTVLVPSRF